MFWKMRNMYSKVLWTLDNQLDGASFERLCSDLLSREGFYKIIPIGGNYDGGRDAELKISKDYYYFQYSLEKNWELKIKKEFKKISNSNKSISKYLFITSQKVTGNKKDNWELSFKQKLGIELIIFDREWLRHRLEENHPDLAEKYLNVPQNESPSFNTISVKINSNSSSVAWVLYHDENYEEAVVEFKKLLKNDPENCTILISISHCLYRLYRYDEALDFINRSIVVDRATEYNISLKACILAESGIQTHSKAKLLAAREIFESITSDNGSSMNYYNYGNTLSALGEFELAEIQYKLAIKTDSQNAEIWKNLGSVYSHLKNHLKEIECYDKALSINPNLAQAQLSKAVTLFTVFNKPAECIKTLESLLKTNSAISKVWSHIWYWLSFAYYKKRNYSKAYDTVEKGLFEHPDHYGLIDIKYVLLLKLSKTNYDMIPETIRFLEFRQKLYPQNIENFLELSKAYKSQQKFENIINGINELLGLSHFDTKDYFLSNHRKPLDKTLRNLKYLDIYQSFRDMSPTHRYYELLGDGLIEEEQLSEFLFLEFFNTFSEGCRSIQNGNKQRKKLDLWSFYSSILNGVKSSLRRLVDIILKTNKPSSSEDKIEVMSKLIAIPMTIALLEVSGQCGYLGGYFLFTDKQMEELTSEKYMDQARFVNNFTSKLLKSTNDEYQLFNK